MACNEWKNWTRGARGPFRGKLVVSPFCSSETAYSSSHPDNCFPSSVQIRRKEVMVDGAALTSEAEEQHAKSVYLTG